MSTLEELTHAVMAENKRTFLEKETAHGRATEDAERLWQLGEPIHRNSVEWTLGILLNLGYVVTKGDLTETLMSALASVRSLYEEATTGYSMDEIRILTLGYTEALILRARRELYGIEDV